MTEAPNPPAPAPPKRKRWWRVQLSLAACVAMMLAAALLLGLNLVPREIRPEKTQFVVVPVYGLPVECTYGEPRIPGYDGSMMEWMKSDEAPLPSVTVYPTQWDKVDLQTKQKEAEGAHKLLETLTAILWKKELRSSWRLPANIAANAAMILAVGYAVEFFRRRRRERRERQG